MNASTTGGDSFSGFGRVRVSSPFVKLEVSEPYVSIDLQRSSVERGHKGEIIGILKRNRPFEGRASVTLLRLPKGITLSEPAVITFSADQRRDFSHVDASA